MSGRKNCVISKASPHTIKKFELIEEYIKSWAQKLMLTESCNGLIFIDCMRYWKRYLLPTGLSSAGQTTARWRTLTKGINIFTMNARQK